MIPYNNVNNLLYLSVAMVQVVFITDYHVPDDLSGQRVLAVVGGCTALGSWDPNDAPRGIEYPPRSGKLSFIHVNTTVITCFLERPGVSHPVPGDKLPRLNTK